jgi:hypothetical protein
MTSPLLGKRIQMAYLEKGCSDMRPVSPAQAVHGRSAIVSCVCKFMAGRVFPGASMPFE